MNHIIRIISVALLAVLPVELSSQNTGLLEKLYDSFASDCVALDCTYEAESEGLTTKGQCQLEVQGASFRMRSSGLDVYCDGQSVWVLDPMAKEAIIEPVSDDSFSYMSNPALLFRDMEKVFTIASSTASEAGMKFHLAARKSCGISKAILEIDRTSVLKAAEFTMDDGSIMKIKVKSIQVLPLKNKDSFVPTDLSSDWIITDLR